MDEALRTKRRKAAAVHRAERVIAHDKLKAAFTSAGFDIAMEEHPDDSDGTRQWVYFVERKTGRIVNAEDLVG